MVQLSIKFDFPISNNQVKYEVLIAALQLASDIGVTRFTICSDSQIVTLQVTTTYRAKDILMQKYLAKVKDWINKLEAYKIWYVPREKNVRANMLSKLASTKLGRNNKSLS